MKAQLRVLALAPYPEEAASTRFRIAQFIPLLREQGIECELRPFIGREQFAQLYNRNSLGRNAVGMALSTAARLGDLLGAPGWDVIFIQREAALLGPPWFEYAVSSLLRKPIVLDLDDPIWIPYESPVYGRLGSRLRWLTKTPSIIRHASHIVCGNDSIAEHVNRMGRPTTILPTIVDNRKFSPRPDRRSGDPIVIGWIGTHTTLPYLQSIVPALERLSGKHRFALKVVGGGSRFAAGGIKVENLDWSLEREIEDFRSLDIGLYPLDDDDWSRHKSGFKAIQYLSCGVPFVASPVGVVREIGRESGAAFLSTSTAEWIGALDRLLGDEALRARMGEAGREFALRRYVMEDHVATLGRICLAARANRFESVREGR